MTNTKKMLRLPQNAEIQECVSKQMKEGFPLLFTELSEDLGRYAEVSKKASMITENFPPSDYPNVLDVCCGLGAYAEALSREGYRVTAIDLSVEQIEACKAKGGSVNYMVGDMRDPPLDDFDLMINMYSSFGYMDTVQEDQSVLVSWHKALRRKGKLIMELSDIERARHSFGFPNERIERSNHGVSESLQIDWTSQIMTIEYRKRSDTLKIMTRLYSKEQLTGMLKAAGFKNVNTFGSLNLKSPKNPSDRLVVVCEK